MTSEVDDRPSPADVDFHDDDDNATSKSGSDESLRGGDDGTIKQPPVKTFSQAPSSHGHLDVVQKVGMSNNEIEDVTEDEFLLNAATASNVLHGLASIVGLPRMFYANIRLAEETLIKAKSDLKRGIIPETLPNARINTGQSKTPPAPNPRRSDRIRKVSQTYAGAQAPNKRPRLALSSKPLSEEFVNDDRSSDHASDEAVESSTNVQGDTLKNKLSTIIDCIQHDSELDGDGEDNDGDVVEIDTHAKNLDIDNSQSSRIEEIIQDEEEDEQEETHEKHLDIDNSQRSRRKLIVQDEEEDEEEEEGEDKEEEEEEEEQVVEIDTQEDLLEIDNSQRHRRNWVFQNEEDSQPIEDGGEGLDEDEEIHQEEDDEMMEVKEEEEEAEVEMEEVEEVDFDMIDLERPPYAPLMTYLDDFYGLELPQGEIISTEVEKRSADADDEDNLDGEEIVEEDRLASIIDQCLVGECQNAKRGITSLLNSSYMQMQKCAEKGSTTSVNTIQCETQITSVTTDLDSPIQDSTESMQLDATDTITQSNSQALVIYSPQVQSASHSLPSTVSNQLDPENIFSNLQAQNYPSLAAQRIYSIHLAQSTLSMTNLSNQLSLPTADVMTVEANETITPNASLFILRHKNVFESSFTKFPARVTRALYSDGRDCAFRLIQLRDQHIPPLTTPSFTLPVGTYFRDSKMSVKAWLPLVKEQGLDFFMPTAGELLFGSNIWGPSVFNTFGAEPEGRSTWQYHTWRSVRTLAWSSDVTQERITRLFHDAISVAGDEVLYREPYKLDKNLTSYQNSSNFVSHLLTTRPPQDPSVIPDHLLETNSSGLQVGTSHSAAMLKAGTLKNLNQLAIRVHDVVMGVALLDLHSKIPASSNQTDLNNYKQMLNSMKKELERVKFAWGPLAGFLTCGVRGLLLVTKDHSQLTVGNCMALLGAAEQVQKLDDIQMKETIWFRTHDYIMELLKKGYSVSQGNVDSGQIVVSKLQLAKCIAYDVGHYWSVQVPGVGCALLPEAYTAMVKLNPAHLLHSGGEEDAMDTDM